jgi:hypothetical protein
MGGTSSTHGKMKSADRLTVEELEGKRPLVRQVKEEDNI